VLGVKREGTGWRQGKGETALGMTVVEPSPNKFVLLCEAALRCEAREGATQVALVIQRSIR